MTMQKPTNTTNVLLLYNPNNFIALSQAVLFSKRKEEIDLSCAFSPMPTNNGSNTVKT
jgi:hypothetical protein